MPDKPEPAATEDRAPYERVPYDASTTPKDLKVKMKEQQLVVDWNDGTRSEFPLALLRRRCPCASCRTEREQQDANPLKILKFDPAGVRVTQAKLIGNYAIQFFWSDGHSTGIFDFRYLRHLPS
jgi:DUF971 family protein